MFFQGKRKGWNLAHENTQTLATTTKRSITTQNTVQREMSKGP